VRVGGDWPVKSPMLSGLSARELRERAQVTDSSAAAENNSPAPWPMPSSFPVVPPGANQAALPLPRLEWFQRVKMTIEKAAREAGGIRLIFDGDSITDNWQGEGKQIWAERYGKLDAFDFGISGDRTEHLLWRLSQGQVNNMHPRLIAIMIGTNNMFTNSEAQIAEGVKAVVDDYRRRCPDATILLQAIFPRGHEPTDPARSKIRTINKIIAGFADGNKIIYRDFGDKFLQPDGTLSADVMPDFLHPNAKGYQIWADAIQPVIEQFFPTKK